MLGTIEGVDAVYDSQLARGGKRRNSYPLQWMKHTSETVDTMRRKELIREGICTNHDTN